MQSKVAHPSFMDVNTQVSYVVPDQMPILSLPCVASHQDVCYLPYQIQFATIKGIKGTRYS